MKKIIINNYNSHTIREKILLTFLENVMPLHTKYFRASRVAWGYSTNDLLLHPPNTLAGQLGLFLSKHHLEPVPKAERHDCFHVLLGFKTDVASEASMQWFLIGSGKKSIFTFGTAILSLMVLPEHYKQYFEAYKKGSTAIDISEWDFKSLLFENTKTLRKVIFKSKLKHNEK
jgi:hypothetical protein